MTGIQKTALLLIASGALTSAMAAALISIDSTSFDLGVVREADQAIVSHSFALVNSGEDTLRIRSVRPGCFCISATFDSIIAPRGTGSVTASIDLRLLPAGSASRSVSVVSNAENMPVIQLTLRLKPIPLIGVAYNFLSLTGAVGDTGTATVTLTSEKKDLAIGSAIFRPQPDTAVPPLRLGHHCTRSAASNSDGLWEYSVALTAAPLVEAKTLPGAFHFKTNHPKKPELKIKGRIVAEARPALRDSGGSRK